MFITLGVANGLEINLSKTYYDVAPTDVDNIELAMMKASHLSDSAGNHYTLGSYDASATVYRMNLAYENGQCQAKVFEMQLNGTMTLPRLKTGNDSVAIQQAFEDQKIMLEEHESVHAQIWQNALRDFEEKIRAIQVKDNESCDQLVHEINQEMSKVLDAVLAQNLAFDCRSYGERLQLLQCH